MAVPVFGERLTWKVAGQLISGLIVLYSFAGLVLVTISLVKGKTFTILPFQQLSQVGQLTTFLILVVGGIVIYFLLGGSLFRSGKRN